MLKDFSKKKSKKTAIVNRTPQYRVGVFNSRCFCSFFFELFVEHFPEKILEKSKISCSKEAHFGEPDVSEHPPS
jgi:hypothetical protein